MALPPKPTPSSRPGDAPLRVLSLAGGDDSGAVGWLADGRLVLTLLSVQQQHVQAMLEDRLGDRYLRLDADWPPDAGLGIDVATPEAVATLCSLARSTVRNADSQRIATFLA